MPETPTAAELVITDRTLDAFQRAVRFERDYADDLRAVAAPVVAAELRRIADGMTLVLSDDPRPFDVGYKQRGDEIAQHHRRRADELDPPARQED